MAEAAAPTASGDPGRPPLLRRRSTWVVAGLVLGAALVALVVHLAWGHDGYSLETAGLGSWTYFAVAALVFGDAICALLPGETTLNAASTMAADGSLELWLVIVAGSIGAIAGDSALYWIARAYSHRIQPKLDKASRNPKVAAALGLLGDRASVLLVAGRYLPGFRFVVNATLGLAHYPYRSFLLWSAVGGILWSIYTCVLAYLVSTALSGFPLASVIISGVITTAAIGIVFIVVRRSPRRSAAAGAAPSPAAAPGVPTGPPPPAGPGPR